MAALQVLHDLGQLLLLLGSFGCFQVNNQQVAHADEAAQNHSTHASQDMQDVSLRIWRWASTSSPT